MTIPGKKFSLIETQPMKDEKMTEAKEAVKKGREPARIDIFKAWCKSCGICVAFCPTGALAKDELGNPFVEDISKCISCGWCEIRCPDFAITVTGKKKDGKKGNNEPEEEGKEGKTTPGQ